MKQEDIDKALAALGRIQNSMDLYYDYDEDIKLLKSALLSAAPTGDVKEAIDFESLYVNNCKCEGDNAPCCKCAEDFGWNNAVEHIQSIIRAAQSAPTGWMDISSAPRDGIWCLYWDARYQNMHVARRGSGDMPCEGDWEYELLATHWMPLPPPPKQQQEGVE